MRIPRGYERLDHPDHEKSLEQHRAYARARTARRKAEGLCIYCGKNPPREGTVTFCERCHEIKSQAVARWREKSYDRHRETSRARERRYRQETLEHYGGKCACCGEETYEFLSLDHIDGGGRAHRRIVRGGKMAMWARTNGYPPLFRVLCHNCNMAKGFYGYCPHDANAT